MIDSSLVRSFKIGNHTITYSFVSIRSIIFKLVDLSVSIGISSLIMEMAKNISKSSYDQWVPICFIWVLFKLYYLYVSFVHIFELSRDNKEVGSK